MYTIGKTVSICAAHKIDRLPAEHPCSNLHGHNYKITVELSAATLDDVGMVLDYNILKDVINQYDHAYLNDLFGELPTTAEAFAGILAKQINEAVLANLNDGEPVESHIRLNYVEVRETESSYARWTP